MDSSVDKSVLEELDDDISFFRNISSQVVSTPQVSGFSVRKTERTPLDGLTLSMLSPSTHHNVTYSNLNTEEKKIFLPSEHCTSANSTKGDSSHFFEKSSVLNKGTSPLLFDSEQNTSIQKQGKSSHETEQQVRNFFSLEIKTELKRSHEELSLETKNQERLDMLLDSNDKLNEKSFRKQKQMHSNVKPKTNPCKVLFDTSDKGLQKVDIDSPIIINSTTPHYDKLKSSLNNSKKSNNETKINNLSIGYLDDVIEFRSEDKVTKADIRTPNRNIIVSSQQVIPRILSFTRERKNKGCNSDKSKIHSSERNSNNYNRSTSPDLNDTVCIKNKSNLDDSVQIENKIDLKTNNTVCIENKSNIDDSVQIENEIDLDDTVYIENKSNLDNNVLNEDKLELNDTMCIENKSNLYGSIKFENNIYLNDTVCIENKSNLDDTVKSENKTDLDDSLCVVNKIFFDNSVYSNSKIDVNATSHVDKTWKVNKNKTKTDLVNSQEDQHMVEENPNSQCSIKGNRKDLPQETLFLYPSSRKMILNNEMSKLKVSKNYFLEVESMKEMRHADDFYKNNHVRNVKQRKTATSSIVSFRELMNSSQELNNKSIIKLPSKSDDLKKEESELDQTSEESSLNIKKEPENPVMNQHTQFSHIQASTIHKTIEVDLQDDSSKPFEFITDVLSKKGKTKSDLVKQEENHMLTHGTQFKKLELDQSNENLKSQEPFTQLPFSCADLHRKVSKISNKANVGLKFEIKKVSGKCMMTHSTQFTETQVDAIYQQIKRDHPDDCLKQCEPNTNFSSFCSSVQNHNVNEVICKTNIGMKSNKFVAEEIRKTKDKTYVESQSDFVLGRYFEGFPGFDKQEKDISLHKRNEIKEQLSKLFDSIKKAEILIKAKHVDLNASKISTCKFKNKINSNHLFQNILAENLEKQMLNIEQNKKNIVFQSESAENVGFKFASGKKININPTALLKSKELFASIDKELTAVTDSNLEVKCPDTNVSKFSTFDFEEKISSEDLSRNVSNENIAKNTQYIEQDNRELTFNYESAKNVGFKTASGNKISINPKALLKSKELFASIGKELNVETDSNLEAKCPDTNVSKFSTFDFEEKISSEDLSRNVSNENIAKNTQSVEQDNRELTFNYGAAKNVGFKTASGNKISINPKALLKSKELFASIGKELNVETDSNLEVKCPDTNVSKFSTFDFEEKISSEDLSRNVSNENIAKNTQSIEQDNRELTFNYEAAKNVGFKTASGNKISINPKALLKSKELFASIGKELNVETVSIGAKKPDLNTKNEFDSCKLKHETVTAERFTDEKIAKTTLTFEQGNKERVYTSDSGKNVGFKSASGKKIKINPIALEKSKELFASIDKELNVETVSNLFDITSVNSNSNGKILVERKNSAHNINGVFKAPHEKVTSSSCANALQQIQPVKCDILAPLKKNDDTLTKVRGEPSTKNEPSINVNSLNLKLQKPLILLDNRTLSWPGGFEDSFVVPQTQDIERESRNKYSGDATSQPKTDEGNDISNSQWHQLGELVEKQNELTRHGDINSILVSNSAHKTNISHHNKLIEKSTRSPDYSCSSMKQTSCKGSTKQVQSSPQLLPHPLSFSNKKAKLTVSCLRGLNTPGSSEKFSSCLKKSFKSLSNSVCDTHSEIPRYVRSPSPDLDLKTEKLINLNHLLSSPDLNYKIVESKERIARNCDDDLVFDFKNGGNDINTNSQQNNVKTDFKTISSIKNDNDFHGFTKDDVLNTSRTLQHVSFQVNEYEFKGFSHHSAHKITRNIKKDYIDKYLLGNIRKIPSLSKQNVDGKIVEHKNESSILLKRAPILDSNDVHPFERKTEKASNSRSILNLPVQEKENYEHQNGKNVSFSNLNRFASASGKKITVSEESFKKAKLLRDNVDGHDMKMESKPEIKGFATASGKNITISKESLKKAKLLLDNVDGNDMKIESKPEIKGFASASGKNITLSEESLKKAKLLLDNVDGNDMKIESKPEIKGFASASGKNITLSEESLKKAKLLLDNVDGNDMKIESKPEIKGFASASGKNITISKESLKKAKLLLDNVDGNDMKIESKPEIKGFASASDKNITLSKESLKKAKLLLDNVDGNDMKIESKLEIKGFASASGKNITLSEESLKKAKLLLDNVDGHDMKIESKPEIKGFASASGKNITISKESLKKAKLLLDNVDGNDMKIESKPEIKGFASASGKNITISKESLKKAKLLLDNVDGNDMKIESKPEIKGFASASGTNITISKESLKKAKLLLDNVDGNDMKIESKPEIKGFASASGKNITLSEEGLKKAKLLLDNVDENDLNVESMSEIKVFASSNDKKETETKVRPLGNNKKLKLNFTSPDLSEKSLSNLPAHSDRSRSQFLPSEFKLDVTDSNLCGKRRKPSESPAVVNKRRKLCFFTNDTINATGHSSRSSTKTVEALRVDLIAEREKALANQRKHIKECCELNKKGLYQVQFETGTFYRAKQNKSKRVPFKEVTNGKAPGLFTSVECIMQGLPESIVGMTLDRATEFQFNLLDSYDPEYLATNTAGILAGDNVRVILNRHNTVGLAEVQAGFRISPGVNCTRVSDAWVRNHYALVVWKLAAIERSYPDRFRGQLCTLDNVLFQLRYRYDCEMENQSSCLKRIVQCDDAPNKRMVLVVSRVFRHTATSTLGGVAPLNRSTSHPLEDISLEVTDGWYRVPARVDEEMKALVARQRVRVGTKLITCNAEMHNNDQGCDPLELKPDIYLKLHTNCTRRAHWLSKLGQCAVVTPLPVSLSSVLARGGLVSSLCVVLARIYPTLYLEKNTGGKSIVRSEKMEARAAMIFQRYLDKQLEMIYTRLQAERKGEERRRGKAGKMSRSEIRAISSGEELYSLVSSSLDSAILNHLSDEQLSELEKHKMRVRDTIAASVNREMKQEVAARADLNRQVTSLLKMKLYEVSSGSAATLTLWRPDPSLPQLLREGLRVRLHYVTSSGFRFGEMQLSSTKHTQFTPLPCDTADTHTRHISLIGSPLTPRFGEIDVVGLVTHIAEVGNKTVVFLANERFQFLAVEFWNGLKESGYEDTVRVGSVVACSNLQYRLNSVAGVSLSSDPSASHPPADSGHCIPSTCSTEHSVYTRNPRAQHLSQQHAELTAQLHAMNLQDYIARCQSLIQTKQAAPPSHSRATPNPANLFNSSGLSRKRPSLLENGTLAKKSCTELSRTNDPSNASSVSSSLDQSSILSTAVHSGTSSNATEMSSSKLDTSLSNSIRHSSINSTPMSSKSIPSMNSKSDNSTPMSSKSCVGLKSKLETSKPFTPNNGHLITLHKRPSGLKSMTNFPARTLCTPTPSHTSPRTSTPLARSRGQFGAQFQASFDESPVTPIQKKIRTLERYGEPPPLAPGILSLRSKKLLKPFRVPRK